MTPMDTAICGYFPLVRTATPRDRTPRTYLVRGRTRYVVNCAFTGSCSGSVSGLNRDPCPGGCGVHPPRTGRMPQPPDPLGSSGWPGSCRQADRQISRRHPRLTRAGSRKMSGRSRSLDSRLASEVAECALGVAAQHRHHQEDSRYREEGCGPDVADQHSGDGHRQRERTVSAQHDHA